MATYYVGARPVLRGRNYNDFVHSVKGVAGTYSFWALMNTGGSVLTGAPDNEYVLGTREQARILEYIFSGGHHIAPLTGPGDGARQDDGRFRPLEYKGLAPIFSSGFGHADRNVYWAVYNNFEFDGLDVANALDSPGHAIRYSTTYGGASRPWVFQGIGDGVMSDPGQALPEGADNDYGHNRVNEWRGVPSSRAL